MSDKKTETFKIGDVEYVVVSPWAKNIREAQTVYNTAYAKAATAGALFRKVLDRYLEKQGLWDDEKTEQLKVLNDEINTAEMKLQKGGIKLNEAREIALQIKKNRNKRIELLSVKNSIDINTVESQAENERFNYFVSVCLFKKDDTGNSLVYKNLDDYLEHSIDEVALKGASILASLMYEINDKYEKNLPENKFLCKWGFADDNLRLINKDGHLIDEKNRLIDENGRFVNIDGSFVDVDGNLLDEDGNYIVEQSPFLNDDGTPISEEIIVEIPDVKVNTTATDTVMSKVI
jgi:hypothetical protein